ncbi:hypothetical protein PENANT_c010G06632 [Penicillium antarcticum]|uniref:DUF1742-domain-containing protein n=1 Tax=Penicillium antarcticum TaxID=416450 RepID=A0A1V6Q8U4_9EURO|nr:hypothetical protein PENANT_c010G06632 [Penicillium antarcticum]
MITPDNKDFFYVCPAHLQDRHFCSPIIDTEGQAACAKEEAMAKEIEKVKKEYEEKQRRKKERENESKSKDDKDEKDKSKEKSKDKEKSKVSNTNDEKERDEKIASIQKGTEPETKADDSPRIFALHKYENPRNP